MKRFLLLFALFAASFSALALDYTTVWYKDGYCTNESLADSIKFIKVASDEYLDNVSEDSVYFLELYSEYSSYRCLLQEVDSITITKDAHIYEAEYDGEVGIGSVVKVKGEGLSFVGSILYGDYPVSIDRSKSNDTVLFYTIPDDVAFSGKPTVINKNGNINFGVSLPSVYLSAPCAAMCNNEFAVKTVEIVGNSFGEDVEVYFASGVDANGVTQYELKSPMVYSYYSYRIAAEVPSGFVPGHPLLLKNKAGESLSDFIFHDESNLLITRDANNDLLGFLPDYEEDAKYEFPKEALKKYFKSDNTNGDFTIFANYVEGSDGDWKVLEYNPWRLAEGEASPKYATVFGPYAQDIIDGKIDINDMVLKFEIYVPKDYPIQMPINIGFFDPAIYSEPNVIRSWCTAWLPCNIYVSRPDDNAWRIIQIEPFTTNDWITVTIPMSEFIVSMSSGMYATAWSKDGIREVGDGTEMRYAYFGDKYHGQPYSKVFDLHLTKEMKSIYEYDYDAAVNYNENSDDMIGDPYCCSPRSAANLEYEWNELYPKAYASGHFNPWGALAFNVNTVDCLGYYKWLFGIDNVRIVPGDGNGFLSEYVKLAKEGMVTRDFYARPVVNCK